MTTSSTESVAAGTPAPPAGNAQPDTPADAGPPRWVDGSGGSADRTAGRISDACASPLWQAWHDIEAAFSERLGGALRTAASGLREVADGVGLDGDPPADVEAWDAAIGSCARGIVERLLDPVGALLDDAVSVERARERIDRALAEARAGAGGLPVSDEVAWGSDALAARDADGPGRRLGKPIARVLSRARKPEGVRPVPLRAMALRHVETDLVPREDRALQGWLFTWARWVAPLDRAVSAWAEVAVPVLTRPFEDSEQWTAAWTELRDAWRALGEALDERLEALPGAGLADDARARLRAAHERLEADVAVAGSFLLDATGTARSTGLLRSGRLAKAADGWGTCLRDRLRLVDETLTLRSEAERIRAELLHAVRERSASVVDGLPTLAAELDAVVAEVRGGAQPGEAEALSARARSIIDPLVEEATSLGRVIEEVRARGEATPASVVGVIRRLPKTLHVVGESATPGGLRSIDRRTVPFRDLAHQSFDALRLDRVRVAAEGLTQPVEELSSEIAGLTEVLEFASAPPPAEETPPDDGAETGQDEAIELVLGAIDNIADSLGARRTEFDRALDAVDGRLRKELGAGTRALWDRVDARKLHAQLIAARSRLSQLRARVNERWGPPVDRAWDRLTRRTRTYWRLLRRGLRRGSEFVGGATGERAGSVRSIRMLAEPTMLTGQLPLVYQRLFTFEPLADPGLLEGRAAELADVAHRFERWEAEDGVPVVVLASQGTGLTSFMNAIAADLESREARVVRLGLPDRVTEESRLAAQVAETLGCSTAESLDGLAEVIFDAPMDSIPDAVIVDDMEHLYLRVPGGTDLVERFLTLMAETEPRIFWIGGVARSAWQLITKAEPTAVTQVEVVDLPALQPPQLRAAVLKRHRRSGLPLHWEAPDGRAIQLRQRLQRIRDPEALAKLFEDDFFERLTRTSGGDLRLALYQWLASADFERGDGLGMSTPRRPDVSLLDSLDLTQMFTLKAFLEHRTLTLSEHDRIFRLPRHESYQIFESLGNRHLIATVGRSARTPTDRSEVEEDLRYQIRPLLVGAVTTQLRARNVVH